MLPSARILLIRPRWLSDEACTLQLRRVRRLFPRAYLTLMAELPASLPVFIETLPLPLASRSPATLHAIRRLRKVRYDVVIVMEDEGRPEAGYGEAKFWAFAANAKTRRFGETRPLYLAAEVADKWQRLVKTQRAERHARGLVERALEPVRQERARHVAASRDVPDFRLGCDFCGIDITSATADAPPDFRRCPQCRSLYRFCHVSEAVRADVNKARTQTWRSLSRHHGGCGTESIRLLAAYVTLSEAHKRASLTPGTYLDVNCGCGTFLDVARAQGWQTRGLDPDTQAAAMAQQHGHTVYDRWDALLEAGEKMRFATHLRVPTEAAEWIACLRRHALLLETGGVVLMRVPDETYLNADLISQEDTYHLYFPSRDAVQTAAEGFGLTLLAMEESLFQDGALDVWLLKMNAKNEAVSPGGEQSKTANAGSERA